MTVEQLRQLEQAATPGEWQPYFTGHGDPYVVGGERHGGPIFPQDIRAEVSKAGDSYGRADAELIAAARNALPALLDIAEAAQAVEAGDVDALLHIGGPVEHRGDLYDTPGCFDVMGDYQEDARYILPARDKLIDQALSAALSRLDDR